MLGSSQTSVACIRNFREDKWAEARHFLFPFHDESPACVAREATARTELRPMDEVVRQLAADALRPSRQQPGQQRPRTDLLSTLTRMRPTWTIHTVIAANPEERTVAQPRRNKEQWRGRSSQYAALSVLSRLVETDRAAESGKSLYSQLMLVADQLGGLQDYAL